MQTIFRKHLGWASAGILAAAFFSSGASANGAIGDHVNDMQAHLKQYSEEVIWLIEKSDELVDTYAEKGSKGAHSDEMIENWEAVDFHSAIETNYVPIYASIWQGIYGVKVAMDNGESSEKVHAEQDKFEQALWQALGAVKLAAQYQQKGLLAKIQTTETEPTTPVETLEDIKHRLDRAVAKYAERLSDAATTIVHDTYLHRFEGVEGALIEQDASLVEDLEKDFNVTLPQAIQKNKTVDAVREVVEAMKVKLDNAKALLKEAEANRKDVF